MSYEKLSSSRTKPADSSVATHNPENLPQRKEKFHLSVQPDLTFSVECPSRETTTAICNDRFIPNRKSARMRFFLDDRHPKEKEDGLCNIYRKHVLSLNGISNFEFGCSSENEPGFNVPDYVKELNSSTTEESRKVRKIPKTPYKVLDAPALQDDFYLNLIDWSSSNILAVGLGSAVYLWAPETGKVTKLCDLSLIDSISSLVWLKRTNQLGSALLIQRLGPTSGSFNCGILPNFKRLRPSVDILPE